MRIIAGELRHRIVEMVDGDDTRPTADKVKESIFNSIGPYFDGGIMLDLFGGSGNIAFESLSRGFEKAWIADVNTAPYKTIVKNAKSLGVFDKCNIMQSSYKNVLEQARLKGMKFDMVYIDPPYALDVYDEIMNLLATNDLVNDDGLVILECSKSDSYANDYGSLHKINEKEYRVARISVYRKEETNE